MIGSLPESFLVCLDWHALRIPFEECRCFLQSQASSMVQSLASQVSWQPGDWFRTQTGLEFMLVSAEGTPDAEHTESVYALSDFRLVACSYFLIYAEYERANAGPQPALDVEGGYGPPAPVPESGPHLAIWTVTKQCRQSCPHCYFFGKGIVHGEDVPLRTARNILEQLADAGIGAVSFSGGEPLLHPHLWELILHAKANGMRVILDTSGGLLDGATRDRVAAHEVDSVIMSLDGGPNDHDVSRGKGSFEATMTALREVPRTGVFTAVNVVLTTFNLHDAEGMLLQAIDAGVDLVKFENVLPAGRAQRNESGIVPGFDRMQQVAQTLDGLRRKYSQAVVVALPIVAQALLSDAPFYCPSGNRFICISNDGFLSPCPSLTHVWQDVHACDLKNQTLREALNTVNFRDPNNLPATCRSCAFGETCLSGCLTRSYYDSGRVMARDPLCAQRKRIVLRRGSKDVIAS